MREGCWHTLRAAPEHVGGDPEHERSRPFRGRGQELAAIGRRGEAEALPGLRTWRVRTRRSSPARPRCRGTSAARAGDRRRCPDVRRGRLPPVSLHGLRRGGARAAGLGGSAQALQRRGDRVRTLPLGARRCDSGRDPAAHERLVTAGRRCARLAEPRALEHRGRKGIAVRGPRVARAADDAARDRGARCPGALRVRTARGWSAARAPSLRRSAPCELMSITAESQGNSRPPSWGRSPATRRMRGVSRRTDRDERGDGRRPRWTNSFRRIAARRSPSSAAR